MLKLRLEVKLIKVPQKYLVQHQELPIQQKFLLLLTPSASSGFVIRNFICKTQKVYSLRLYASPIIPIEGMQHAFSIDESLAIIARMWVMQTAELKAKYKTLEYTLNESFFYLSNYQKLLTMIPNMKIVANIRNPYAMISSKAGRMKLHYFNQKHQQIKYQEFTRNWITHACIIRKAVTEDNIPLVTYEQFCKDPLQIITAFGLDKTEFTTDLKLKVKDYPPQLVTNMNEAQIALLTDWQKDVINEQLSKEGDLLTEFNYQLLK